MRNATALVLLTSALTLVSTAHAVVYTGSLSSAGGQIVGAGSWVAGAAPATLSWSIEQYGENTWRYCYAMSVPGTDLDHLVLEAPSWFTAGDVNTVTGGVRGVTVRANSPGGTNPGLPETIYGLNVTAAPALGLLFLSFRTNHGPAWGDFYATNGQADETAAIWNAGFTAHDDDPAALPGSGSVNNHVLVPDIVEPIPEPMTSALLALGACAVLIRTRT